MITEKLKLEEKLNKEITTFFHKKTDWNIQFEKKKKITYDDFLSNKILKAIFHS